ncbi:amino acid permease [Russula emetica]|nr:amino acid permease [Russula emetica]
MTGREYGTSSLEDDDDKKLESLGYVPSFKREFSNLATVSSWHDFPFSCEGLCSSVATTFNTPLLLGGPSSVTWCWILGATMCFTLGRSFSFSRSSIAEIVSAFPTCGSCDRYTASAQLVPKRHRPIVGWLVGWLNILGQVAGMSSTEFGLSNMIWAAVVVAKDGNYEVTSGKVVGLFVGLLVFHGILNCLATRHLATFTKGFVFVNLGTTVIIVIVLLATTSRHDMHHANYVFGSDGIINQTNGWNNGVAFLFGLLSVQWTVRDYDATAHISEEVKRAAYAAPAAIFIAVIGTGLLGWLLNIVLVLCSGPLCNLPGPSGSAFLQACDDSRFSRTFWSSWTFVCLTAFFVCQTALHACSRTVYAFSRDKGFPDNGYFGHISKRTHTPLRAIGLTTFLSILPGLLDFASPVSANAIFSLTAMALDISYIIPIALRRIFRHHPEVQFKPGPFYLGDGLLGWAVNLNCIMWTLFVSVIFSLPTYLPVTSNTMNYASVITGSVLLLAMIWYFVDGRRHYHGPHAYITENVVSAIQVDEGKGEKDVVDI